LKVETGVLFLFCNKTSVQNNTQARGLLCSLCKKFFQNFYFLNSLELELARGATAAAAAASLPTQPPCRIPSTLFVDHFISSRARSH
jgi:hypothetical protein